jgi:hypothetical protein
MPSPARDDAGRGSDGLPCVVYLAWGPLGAAPVRDFVRSYREHPAGAAHRLVVVLNGVEQAAAAGEPLLHELRELEHELIELERPVLDLVAYRQAAERLQAPRYCFLNSYSRVLADGWLAHLDGALADPGVGLAGAGGSWASMLSYALFALGLPSAYGPVFRNRADTLAQFEKLHEERTGQGPPDRWLKRQAGALLSLLPMLVGFARFPAHHLRTNAFATRHGTLTGAFTATMRRKVQAHRLESGRASLTRHVERAGMRAVVVDRDGRSWDRDAWPDSETFWQGGQRGLLVADNQTDYYADGDPQRRLLLSRYAWGERAAPDAE